VRLAIRLTPNAGVDRVDGVVDGVLRARVAARAVEGAANEALLRLLAASLGVARGRVALVRGATARMKVVEVVGVGATLVRERWPGVEV
jgi:uncharacterized protein YggU (UPF0235/DUF167 family)